MRSRTLGTLVIAGVLVGVPLVAVVVWVLELAGPEERSSLTTDTHSSSLATDAQKVAFLARYLTYPSQVQAAEFHVIYHDNSGGLVPGPSDWDIRAALKVEPADLSRWTEGMEAMPAGEADLSWGYELLPNDPRWGVESEPRVYRRGGNNTIVAIFATEGVVFKRAWTE